jgi:hypothetical protein
MHEVVVMVVVQIKLLMMEGLCAWYICVHQTLYVTFEHGENDESVGVHTFICSQFPLRSH